MGHFLQSQSSRSEKFGPPVKHGTKVQEACNNSIKEDKSYYPRNMGTRVENTKNTGKN